MAKASAEIRSLARSHTVKAINTLVGIMNEKKAPAAARVSASNSLLDRGWGKSPTVLEDGDGNALSIAVVRFAGGEK